MPSQINPSNAPRNAFSASLSVARVDAVLAQFASVAALLPALASTSTGTLPLATTTVALTTPYMRRSENRDKPVFAGAHRISAFFH